MGRIPLDLASEYGGGLLKRRWRKEDKQGLGITKRNKKRFQAQQSLEERGRLPVNGVLYHRVVEARHRPLGGQGNEATSQRVHADRASRRYCNHCYSCRYPFPRLRSSAR